MTKKNLNDLLKRYHFQQNEIKLISLKLSLRLNYKIKINNLIKLENLNKKNSLNKIKNRCILTGRSKSIYSKFSISRIKLREMFFSGLVIGLRKY